VSDLGEEFPAAPDEPAEVAALDLSRHEKVAMAYHLHHVQRQTVDYTAQKLGVSRATAWRMAREGQAQAKFLQEGPEDVTQALADGARWLAGALADERATLAAHWREYAPIILKVFEFEAKVRKALPGEGPPGGVVPNPHTIAALDALYAQEGGPDGIAPRQ
jgi:predicted DNA-binding protein (UPF0251 family)